MTGLVLAQAAQVMPKVRISLACLLLALAGVAARAETGKLLLTGGVGSIDGAAGGGLTPWAVIGSAAADDQWGLSANLTRVTTRDYAMTVGSLVLGLNNRLELSLAEQRFSTGITGAALGLHGLQLRQQLVGLKWRVAGEAILDSDRAMPQIALGVQAKSLGSTGLDATLAALGAKRSGVDVYVSASKLFLEQGLLANLTLRATRANQNGLLGFGATLGGSQNAFRLQPEISLAYLLARHLAIGVEYRAKPNNLQAAGRAAGLDDGLREDDWKDIFLAWAINPHATLTLAYVDLGRVAPFATASRKQSGAYASLQVNF